VQVHEPVVLIVDDEWAIFEALRRELRHEKLKLLYAPGGREALDVLEGEPVDILICDQQMPGMPGIELLKSVSTRHPEIVRILLTGNASMRLALDAINKGSVYKLLTKPCEPEELRTVLREALRFKLAGARK